MRVRCQSVRSIKRHIMQLREPHARDLSSTVLHWLGILLNPWWFTCLLFLVTWYSHGRFRNGRVIFKPAEDLLMISYLSCTPSMDSAAGQNAPERAFVNMSAFWYFVPMNMSSVSSLSNCSLTDAKLILWTLFKCLSFLGYPAVHTFTHASLSSLILSKALLCESVQNNSAKGIASLKRLFAKATVSLLVVLRDTEVCFLLLQHGGKDVPWELDPCAWSAATVLWVPA